MEMFKTIWIMLLYIVIIVPLVTIVGACSGWFVGLFFGERILGFLTQYGISGVTMFDFGAIMGFISAFLRSGITK